MNRASEPISERESLNCKCSCVRLLKAVCGTVWSTCSTSSVEPDQLCLLNHSSYTHTHTHTHTHTYTGLHLAVERSHDVISQCVCIGIEEAVSVIYNGA